MAALTATPKAPPRRIVTVPSAPAPAPASPHVTEPESQTAPDGEIGDGGGGASQDRESLILKQGRGRAGTVLTGFRGLLDPADFRPRRKTLLGE